ncbi:DoxX family membrane protein [Pedobacter sp. MC2016-15]|uniref:DoxX family membrane protein n=1 Tax=Pedobacter sp. MC2016-15 TaxID=2994473 RepID=UPI0022472328|nr:DoxX family membrane protein [Pedobacter sp. MC2016-15]
MKNSASMAQLLLRFSLGIGFLLPVLDRIGAFGPAGTPNIFWGNWTNFVAYTHQLMPYISLGLAWYFAFAASALEVIIGLLLIVGYKVRYAACGSFALTLIFALSMMFFLHFRAPFSYSVFVVSFSSLLLASFPDYRWSLDDSFK